MGDIYGRFIGYNSNTLDRYFGLYEEKEGNNMGALIMFGLVSAIAIVSVIYFHRQDKKEARRAGK